MQEFYKILKENQLQLIKIISTNNRKGRINALCKDKEGRELFVKYNLPNLPGTLPFLMEKCVYDIVDVKYIPKHFYNDDLLILEKCTQIQTARFKLMKFIRNNGDFVEQEKIIKAVLDNYCGICEAFDNANIAQLDVKSYSFCKYLSKFLSKSWLSGPEIQPIKTSPSTKNRILRYIFEIGTFILTFFSKKNKRICHGDPHLNNYLGGDRDLVCIDFEDVCLGFREVELAYIVAQIEALYEENKNKKLLIEFLKPIEKQTLKKVKGNYNLYIIVKVSICMGMKRNPRYLNDENEGANNEQV